MSPSFQIGIKSQLHATGDPGWVLLKWDASSRWPSSLYYPMRNSDQMIIGKTHPTLFFRSQESNKNFSKNRFVSIFNVETKLEILVRQFLYQNILWLFKILISNPNFEFMAVIKCKRMNQNEHNLNHYKNLLVRWLISIWRHQKSRHCPESEWFEIQVILSGRR